MPPADKNAKNAMDKHVKHFNEAKHLGWKLLDNPAEAQVLIRSAGLEVIDLTTKENPTVTTISNKPALSDTKVGQSLIKHASNNTSVGQSAIADGNDISGDCNLHAEQLQVFNHDKNTKDEAQKKTNDDISKTIGKTHSDIS